MRDVLRRMARANRPHLHTLTPQQARAAYEAGAGCWKLRRPLSRIEDMRIPARDGHALLARLYAPRAQAEARCRCCCTCTAAASRLAAWPRTMCCAGSWPIRQAVRSCRWTTAWRQSTSFPPPATMRGMPCSGWRSTAPAWGWTAPAWPWAATALAVPCRSVRLLARDTGLPLQLQVLIYPGTCAHQDTDSHFAYAHGLVLERAGIQWFLTTMCVPPPTAKTGVLPRCWPMTWKALPRRWCVWRSGPAGG